MSPRWWWRCSRRRRSRPDPPGRDGRAADDVPGRVRRRPPPPGAHRRGAGRGRAVRRRGGTGAGRHPRPAGLLLRHVDRRLAGPTGGRAVPGRARERPGSGRRQLLGGTPEGGRVGGVDRRPDLGVTRGLPAVGGHPRRLRRPALPSGPRPRARRGGAEPLGRRGAAPGAGPGRPHVPDDGRAEGPPRRAGVRGPAPPIT